MPSLQPKASVYKCLEDFRLQYHHGSKSIIPDQNPVKAGFVIYAEAWQYSSAADYSDERNDFIELLYVE